MCNYRSVGNNVYVIIDVTIALGLLFMLIGYLPITIYILDKDARLKRKTRV